ncbi:MAG TPA: hypothetical protein VIO38_09335, partial [Rariglobus sp.]
MDEKNFQAQLDELTRANDYAGALQLIREARQSKPAWLDGREGELSREEIRFNGRTGDLLALRSAARLYINGDRLRSARIIEIARELRAAGRAEEAVFLLKELLAKDPSYAVGRKLLAEWSPPAPPAAKAP